MKNKYGKGIKVVENNEWNNLDNSLNSIHVGSKTADYSTEGIYIGGDALHTPHYSTFNERDKNGIIIGEARQESYYPYNDIITYDKMAVDYVWSRSNAGSEYEIKSIDKYVKFGGVVTFPTPIEVTPEVSEDLENGSVYGYSLNFVPILEGLSATAIGGDLSAELNATIIWDLSAHVDAYGIDLDGEGYYVDIFNGEYLSGYIPNLPYTENWGYLSDIEGLDFLYGTPIGNATVDQNYSYIPVGVAWFDVTTNQINRNIQLLMGTPHIPSAGGGSTIPTEEFRHPFKGQVSGNFDDGYSIAIAPDRAEDTYEFKDIITIIDPDTDFHVDITYPEGEYIEITEDSYVYYELYKNGSQWESVLKTTNTWVPEEAFAGNIKKVIGYANLSGEACFWGQEMFECPTIHAPDIRGEFEAYYELSGSVTIAAGTVETFNGDSASINAQTYPLNTPTDIWVRATSSESGGNPSVSITGLYSGTYPGFYQSISEAEKRFNYKIGEITSEGNYQPAHIGRLHIDNTLLTPDINDSYSSDVDSPRMMEFHDDQVYLVGNDVNDLLINSKFLELQVRGGGVEHLIEKEEVKFYGKTETTGSTGSGHSINDTSFTLSGQSFTTEFDRGLYQGLSAENNAELNVLEGTGIDFIKVDADNVSINCPLSGINSVDLDWGTNQIQLVNDEEAPGNDHYYGTNSGGTKGYHPLTTSASFTQITVVTNVQLLSSGLLQKKTRTAYVYNPSSESVWTNAGQLPTSGC